MVCWDLLLWDRGSERKITVGITRLNEWYIQAKKKLTFSFFFQFEKKCMLSLRYMKVLLVLWFLKSKAKRNNLCIIRKVGVKFSPIFRLHHYDQMCSRHLFCLCLWLWKIVFWKKINMSPLFSLGFFQPLCAADAHPLSVVSGLFQPYLIYWTLGFVLVFFL